MLLNSDGGQRKDTSSPEYMATLREEILLNWRNIPIATIEFGARHRVEGRRTPAFIGTKFGCFSFHDFLDNGVPYRDPPV